MNGAEMFMGCACSTALCRRRFFGGLAVQHRSTRAAGLELVLAVDDDRARWHLSPESISACPSLICATVIGRICDRVVGLDHIDIGAVRALLHRRRRDTVSPSCRVSSSSRALTSSPGQSMCAGIGKIGLEPDRAGRLQDLVVDQRELALVELDLVVLAVGEDRERPLGHLLLDFRQVGLGQREDHRDRLRSG